jgi:hypothetical protein
MLHRSSKRFGFILSSALALFGSLAAAQSASPRGSFGFLANALTNDPADSRGLGVVGVLNLDGAGNIAGAYTLCNRPPRTITGSVTGTYTEFQRHRHREPQLRHWSVASVRRCGH